MPRYLHLVPRPDAAAPAPVAERLLETASPEREVRVVELFDAPAGANIVDLTLADRHTAEVTAALHWADEVHAHGVHPVAVLDALPYVRKEVLGATSLVLHGPWRARIRSARTSARLHKWPGRVFRDQRADPKLCPVDSTLIEFGPVLDRNDPRMLPRAVGPRPMRLEDGPMLALVGLSKDLPDADRRALRHALATVSRPSMRIEVMDEADVPRVERAETRRALQAYVVPEITSLGWQRSTLEAVAQGLPLVVLGASVDDPPPGAVFTSVREPVDKAVSCIRSWATAWAKGDPAPVDLSGRRDWLDRV